MAGNGNDVNVLIPPPYVFRVGGEELRLQALPVKRLLGVVQYIQGNVDLLDKMQSLDEPGALNNVAELLNEQVYKRMSGLIRLLFDKTTADKMTDEWCMEHLSNAHYAAILKKAIEQNQLDWLFQRAKEYLGHNSEMVLRRMALQGKEEKKTDSV